ncbi:HAD family hydrolase [Oscillatoria sp. FACHB-1406]|uniref:HAD family hydrolase n=1 Tax=Oscillatoria sp. FACHB-1406 TaxID=2692846 RepID=UPI0016867407|nr:HAD family hydrolase [Oscillatoria sp. FACHB-1406]MBD2578062.1 HAD family hydrolase [Oscillatoria sp. FACHB-1406]
MSSDRPDILALDFDGVLCDGLLEYFQSSWRAYCQVWQPETLEPPAELEASFMRSRPVIETGWEMPLLIRALILGVSEAEILGDWLPIASGLLMSEGIEAKILGKTLDAVRDDWMVQDLGGWLGLHRFYPEIAEKVRQTIAAQGTQVIVITTKEGRFTQRLLQQQAIELPPTSIIGKEVKQPKHETLRQIIADRGSASVWFVEDRLKTLQLIEQQPDLGDVGLYLGDWGYNTEVERESARQDARIKVLSRDRFAGEFAGWNE